MEPTHIFINGCSFLTYRVKDGIMTHAGKELEKLMGLARGGHLAGGGRGNKRVSITTKIWCQRNPELAKKCFFVIGITSGSRFDFPTNDGYKKYKFPDLESAWKTFSPQKDTPSRNFFKHLFSTHLDIDQLIQYESIETTVNLQNFFKLNFKKISSLEGWGDLSASNLEKAIQKSKKITLDKLIFSIGIRPVSYTHLTLPTNREV